MILLTIKRKNNNLYNIFAGGKLLGVFSKNSVLKLKLKNNEKYPIEYVKKLRTIYIINAAKKKALNLLSIKDYSQIELYNKLKKYTSEKVAKYVVLNLKKLGFLNDIKYAKNLAQKLIITKSKSKQFTKFALIKKGIEKETAEKVVNSIKINEITQIENLILKKYINKIKDYKSKNKILTSISRLGFFKNDILKAMQNLKNKENLKF